MTITYFQNHVVTITYDPDWKLATAVWEGFLSSQEFREAVTMCLRLIEEYKPLRWLGDNRKMKVIRQADQDWFVANVLPQIQGSTIRRHATVVSEDIFNKMAVEQIIRRADDIEALYLKDFDNKLHALTWVKEPLAFENQGV